MNIIHKIFLKFKSFAGIAFSANEHNLGYADILKTIKGITGIQTGGENFEFTYFEMPLFARKYPCSDMLVVKQVLLQHEYRPAVDFFKDNFSGHSALHIIDAGANVGYASVYFLKNFSNAEIACIEPDTENARMIEKNLAAYIQKGSVKIFLNALMDEKDKNILIKKDFRGGKDWSLTVAETKDKTGLRSITISEIIKQQQWDQVDILKIDIEGAERFVLSNNSDVSYLQKVKLVTIEIHDEFKVRENIYDVLRNNNFLLLNFGETTFCINKLYMTQ